MTTRPRVNSTLNEVIIMTERQQCVRHFTTMQNMTIVGTRMRPRQTAAVIIAAVNKSPPVSRSSMSMSYMTLIASSCFSLVHVHLTAFRLQKKYYMFFLMFESGTNLAYSFRVSSLVSTPEDCQTSYMFVEQPTTLVQRSSSALRFGISISHEVLSSIYSRGQRY